MQFFEPIINSVAEPHQEYFVTFACANKVPFFNHFQNGQAFCQQIAVNQQHYQCLWVAWVLMPDHFHGLLRLDNSASLSEVVGHLKGSSAAVVNSLLARKGKVWQSGFYDHKLSSEQGRFNIARYIVANPTRSGICESVRQYPFWDCVYL